MNLLVVYEMNPDKVFSFVVSESDSRFELFRQAHGLMVNSNDEDYPSEVVEAISNISEESTDIPETPMEISGDFRVIHCGFVL